MAEMSRRLNQAMTQHFTMRSRAQVTRLLRRLRSCSYPGVVLTHQWNSGRRLSRRGRDPVAGVWAGVARQGPSAVQPRLSPAPRASVRRPDTMPERHAAYLRGFRRYERGRVLSEQMFAG